LNIRREKILPIDGLLSKNKEDRKEKSIKTINFNVAKNPQDGPGGDTEEALWRNLLNANHQRLSPLLELTMGEVFHYPFNSNKTRIARP